MVKLPDDALVSTDYIPGMYYADRRVLTPKQVDEIAKEYLAGASSYDLGEKYKVSSTTIRDYLRSRNVNMRLPGMPAALTPQQVDEIAKEYLAGAGAATLSRKYNVTPGTILYNLRLRNVNIRPPTRPNTLTPEQVDEIVKEYLAGVSSYDLGEKYDVSHSTIISSLKSRNVSIRPSGVPTALTPEQVDEIAKEYLAGVGSTTLSRKYNVTPQTILNYLRSHNTSIIPPRTPTLLTPEQIDEIVKEYLAGVGSTTLSEKYNVAPVTILNYLRSRNVGIGPHAASEQYRLNKLYCEITHPLEKDAIDVIRLSDELAENPYKVRSVEELRNYCKNSFIPKNLCRNGSLVLSSHSDIEYIHDIAKRARQFLKQQLDKQTSEEDIDFISRCLK